MYGCIEKECEACEDDECNGDTDVRNSDEWVTEAVYHVEDWIKFTDLFPETWEHLRGIENSSEIDKGSNDKAWDNIHIIEAFCVDGIEESGKWKYKRGEKDEDYKKKWIMYLYIDHKTCSYKYEESYNWSSG